MRDGGQALPQVAFGLVLAASLVILFLPSSGVPTAPPGTDKAVHLALFAVLAATGRWAGVRTPRLAAGLVAYAVLSELVQGLAPLGRSASVADGAADVAGVAVGLLVWHWRERRAR